MQLFNWGRHRRRKSGYGEAGFFGEFQINPDALHRPKPMPDFFANFTLGATFRYLLAREMASETHT